MAITTVLIFALGAGIVGVILGCLIFNLMERSLKRQKNNSLTKPHRIIKPNELGKDALEVLFESHNNILKLENPEVLLKPDWPTKPEVGVHKNVNLSMEQQIISGSPIPEEPEIVTPEIIPIRENKTETTRSVFIMELETNLAIATTRWADKPILFQTEYWDNKQEKIEPVIESHLQELIQLYVDIDLANNVVWLATEMNHRSKELDESYIKLCDGIAERIQKIMPPKNQQNPVQTSTINTAHIQIEPIALPSLIQRTKKRVTRKSTSLKKEVKS
jgi:hypothetical protein